MDMDMDTLMDMVTTDMVTIIGMRVIGTATAVAGKVTVRAGDGPPLATLGFATEARPPTKVRMGESTVFSHRRRCA